MTEEQGQGQDKDIQDILSGLDDILKTIGGPKAVEPAPAPKAPEPPAPAVKKPEPAPPAIELGPRAGILGAEAAAPKGLSSQPASLEIKLGDAAGPPKAAEPAPAPEKKPEPTPSAAKPPQPSAPLVSADIPQGAPKEQVRRVAFLHSPEQKAKCGEFMAFLADVAQKVSKKPLYLQTALVFEVSAGISSAGVLEKAKEAGAVAVLGVLAGLKDSQVKEIEEAFENADIFMRVVPPGDVNKRPLSIDLVVDMMLLKSG